eukprot:6951593-Pyramimonas_sp.AAC.1
MQTTRCRLREFAAEEPQALWQHIRSAHLAAHRDGHLIVLGVVADHGRCAEEGREGAQARQVQGVGRLRHQEDAGPARGAHEGEGE